MTRKKNTTFKTILHFHWPIWIWYQIAPITQIDSIVCVFVRFECILQYFLFVFSVCVLVRFCAKHVIVRVVHADDKHRGNGIFLTICSWKKHTFSTKVCSVPYFEWIEMYILYLKLHLMLLIIQINTIILLQV